MYTLEHEMNDLGLHVEHMEFELQCVPYNGLLGRDNHPSKCETEKEAGEKMLSHVLSSTEWPNKTPCSAAKSVLKLTAFKLM